MEFFINENRVGSPTMGKPTIGGYFCYAGRTKPVHFRPMRSALLSPCASSKFYFIDRRAHQTINVSCFPRETRPIRVIRLCNIIVRPLLLSNPRGGLEWSTITVLRGSGTLAREGTSRKLNTSIFSMFTVEESLFNHGNDKTSNGESKRERESKMHRPLYNPSQYWSYLRHKFSNEMSK